MSLSRELRAAADLVNSINYPRQLKPGGPGFPHVVAWASFPAQLALMAAGFGNGPSVELGPLQSDKVQVFGQNCGQHWQFPCAPSPQGGGGECNSGYSVGGGLSEGDVCMTRKEATCYTTRNPPGTKCNYCKGVLHPPQEINEDGDGDVSSYTCQNTYRCIGYDPAEVDGVPWPNGKWKTCPGNGDDCVNCP